MDELIATLENKISSIIQQYSDIQSEAAKKDHEINDLKVALSNSEEKQREIKARLEGIIQKLEKF